MWEKFYLHFAGMKIISITFLNASFNIRNRCHDYHYNNVEKKKKKQKQKQKQKCSKLQNFWMNNFGMKHNFSFS